MTYLQSNDPHGAKRAPKNPDAEQKPKRPLNRRRLLIIVAALVALAVIVVGAITLSGTISHQNEVKAKQTQVAAKKKNIAAIRASVLKDVQATTVAAKAYLKTNPKANLTQMTENIKVSNSRIADGETVTIVALGTPDKAYQSWQVSGSDSGLSQSLSYTYQSFSNTFRWFDNKDGSSSDVTVDKAPRNTGASGGETK